MKLPKGKLLTLVVIFVAIGLVTATGAFTTVSATRTATVSVAGDSSALLGLDPGPDNDYASITDGTLQVTLASVNLDAVTKIEHVFTITNNGQTEVAVNITNFDYVDSDSSNGEEGSNHEDVVYFVVNKSQLDGSTSGLSTTLSINGEDVYSLAADGGHTIDIGSGDSVSVGMYVDMNGVTGLDPDSANDDLTDLIDEIQINAHANGVDDDTDSDDDNLEAKSSP